MVGIALILLVFALAGTAILTYMGYGLASLLLPREWKSDRGLLAPLLGYAFLLLVGYYAVSTVLNLQHALRITLILATVLNVVALWRHKGERLTIRLGETGWAWLLAALVFLVSVLPLLHYGYATTIGENWDPEDYLPVADYLVQVPVKDIATMPPNPLRDLNADPPRIGLTLGFSIVQGALQQLVGWDALRSFAPTMALLRGLAVLAFYLLFRRTLRMPQMPALLATLLAGANALALWIAFFNFGMQASAMVLVPLGLVLLASVLRQPSWRGVLAAGLAAAGLPIAYCPALTALVPMAAALGLYELIAARKRWPVLAAGLATAGASPLLAGGTVLDYRHGFAARYAQQKTTLLTHFVPWSDILGFSPFSLRPEAARPLLAGLQTAALALIVLLALVALVRNRDRALWLAVVLPGLLYLAWLRGWIGQAVLFLQQHRILPALGEGVVSRLQPYPYAYLKGAAFVAPVLLGLGVQGFWEFKSWGEKGRAARVSRILAIFPAAFLLVLTGWSADRIVARYWARPARFDREALRIEEAVALLPKGAPVYLTGRTERGRPLRLSLEAWENSFEGARHYAWWGPLALPERGQVSLRADLSQREARAWIGKQETPFSPHPGAESWPAVADGSYFAALWVYYGAHVVEVVPVGQFRLEAGQVQGLGPIPLSPYLLWPHSPAESSGARFGPSIEPSGYERGTGPFPPGESVPLALEWHTLAGLPTDYSVTVQIVGRGRLWGQWDGPIGQWYPGTAWKPEQYIRDDIPLQAAADAPRGHYRLIVAVSDPATMQRLPVYSPAGESLGDALDLGEIVVR